MIFDSFVFVNYKWNMNNGYLRTLTWFLLLAGVLLYVSCEKATELSEEEQIQNYLKKNDIVADPTPTGLYYIEYIKGGGEYPVYLDTVEVTYTGFFLSGQIFDSGSLEFTVGQGDVIAGWDEGITYMQEGGKALLIVPSKLGYGSRGYYNIPANAVLLFQMDLDDIRFGPNHN